jgi:hypothetical protein
MISTLIAAMVLAGAAPDAPATRAIVGPHSVAAEGPPALRIEVPATARYAGGERFVLFDNADCEFHVFVEADAGKRIRRLYWVQFEDYLPSLPDARYTYGKRDRPMTLWGERAWISRGFGKSDFATRPGSDREHLRDLLKRAGYSWPPKMMQTRIVRLLDDPQGTGFGQRELMLIYAEDLALSGEDFEALGGDGEDTDRWRAIVPALVERAAASFKVITLDPRL